MLRGTSIAAALVAGVALAAPAQADSRDIQSAVDGYLAGPTADAALVGGPGSAGYDSGFWIRGGDFSLKINLTLQARFEGFGWDEVEPSPGGDLSGFSLPRATVKFSGTAPCSTCYYLELEFGHVGDVFFLSDDGLSKESGKLGFSDALGGFFSQSFNYDPGREAWIEWCNCESFNVRMGQIKTPTTRQLMTPPELQQFVDVSLASGWTGFLQPGYTDRNRDHGILFHGTMGCNGEWSWMAAITNGDGGDSIRNVLDDRSDDNLAMSGRLNWAFLKPIYYEEGALRQTTCEWYGEVGAWAHHYADRVDKPHTKVLDNTTVGLDLALGYGGFSFTGAYTMSSMEGGPSAIDVDWTMILAQLGYHFPGTAWEIAARWSSSNVESGSTDYTVTEFSGAVNYYLNGHANKLTLDVSMYSEDEPSGQGSSTGLFFDIYAGVLPLVGVDDTAILIRFQWQLAL